MVSGMDMMACPDLAVPAEIMQHVVEVESSRNPFAIGVVGARLARQPENLGEAVSTVRMLETKGYNYSLGLAQINRANLGKYGLDTYEKAFDICPNVVAGSLILAQCHARAHADWSKAFSCYYSGNFTSGIRDGYVQKIIDSMERRGASPGPNTAIALVRAPTAASKNAPELAAIATARRVAMRTIAFSQSPMTSAPETVSETAAKASNDIFVPVVKGPIPLQDTFSATPPTPSTAAEHAHSRGETDRDRRLVF